MRFNTPSIFHLPPTPTSWQATNPYLSGIPTNTYNPYFSPAGHLVPTALLGPDPAAVQSSLSHGVVPQGVSVAQQKIPRSDRLEVSTNSPYNRGPPPL